MTISTVHTIIKIGSQENIKRLQTLGEVYLNTWGFFRRYEINRVQGDPDEGLAAMYQASNGHQLHIQVGDEWVPIGGLAGQIKFSPGNIDAFNIYSMLAVTDESYNYLNDHKLLEFGDTALIMTDGDEFISRLSEKLKNDGIPHQYGLVEYVETVEHEGDMGPFRKLSNYKYQSEWRLLAEVNIGSPITVSLGDLSGISCLIPASEMTARTRIET